MQEWLFYVWDRFEFFLHQPPFIIYMVVGFFNLVMCMFFWGVKKSFVEQGSMVMWYEPLPAVVNGLLFYFFLLALCVVYALTIAFLPVAFLFLIGLYMMLLWGEASLAVLLGHFVFVNLGFRSYVFFDLVLGALLLHGITLLPIVGFWFAFLVLPVLSLGVATKNLTNGFVDKKFFVLPFWQEQNTPKGQKPNVHID